ncbi:MAG TPA: DUF3303 family protein [Gemmatimonadaceae bacterium]|nr:DUF3303 family protein [Gemmatimonadaceae bacterium]
MLYMVVEHYREGSAPAIYARLRERGRMMPEGLHYRGSWVTTDRARCFQLMECDDPALFDAWTAAWQDLVEFEIVPVVTSAEAQAG